MENSSWFKKFKERKIGQTLAVYLGSSWVFIEAINFLIDKYDLNAAILDVPILLVIFGLPAILIHTWFQQKFTRKAIILQSINGIIALSIIIFTLANPGRLNPTQLRLLKFKDDQKKLAEAIQSIVILPFDNYTGNDEYEYFVSGMHSSLIGDLGQIGALRVISKTSSRVFKGTAMSIPEIASELNVDAVIEASVSCIEGDKVCIQIRLVSAFPEEQQLWVQDYYEDKSQILNLYNRVTKQISEEINIMLTPQEENLLAETRTVNPEAYDAYLMGQFYWEKLDPEFMEKALEYFQRAIELEPEWADPYASLATVYGSFYVLPKSVTLPLKYKYLNKAMELDPNSANVRYVKAGTAVWTEWDWEQGEREFLKSLELNPNNALCRLYYAHLLMILRRSDEAVQQANLGLELDPMRPLVLGLYGVVMIGERNYQSAISAFEKARTIAPDFRFAFNILPAQYLNGDYEDWIRTWEKKVRWNDDAKASVVNTFHEKGHIAAIEEMFKMNDKYGDGIGNAHMTNSLKARRSMYLNKPEKAVEYLGKMCDEDGLNATYIGTELYYFSKLKDNPRYIELLKKMNLPQ